MGLLESLRANLWCSCFQSPENTDSLDKNSRNPYFSSPTAQSPQVVPPSSIPSTINGTQPSETKESKEYKPSNLIPEIGKIPTSKVASNSLSGTTILPDIITKNQGASKSGENVGEKQENDYEQVLDESSEKPLGKLDLDPVVSALEEIYPDRISAKLQIAKGAPKGISQAAGKAVKNLGSSSIPSTDEGTTDPAITKNEDSSNLAETGNNMPASYTGEKKEDMDASSLQSPLDIGNNEIGDEIKKVIESGKISTDKESVVPTGNNKTQDHDTRSSREEMTPLKDGNSSNDLSRGTNDSNESIEEPVAIKLSQKDLTTNQKSAELDQTIQSNLKKEIEAKIPPSSPKLDNSSKSADEKQEIESGVGVAQTKAEHVLDQIDSKPNEEIKDGAEPNYSVQGEENKKEESLGLRTILPFGEDSSKITGTPSSGLNDKSEDTALGSIFKNTDLVADEAGKQMKSPINPDGHVDVGLPQLQKMPNKKLNIGEAKEDLKSNLQRTKISSSIPGVRASLGEDNDDSEEKGVRKDNTASSSIDYVQTREEKEKGKISQKTEGTKEPYLPLKKKKKRGKKKAGKKEVGSSEPMKMEGKSSQAPSVIQEGLVQSSGEKDSEEGVRPVTWAQIVKSESGKFENETKPEST